eukprot:1150708-Pelagomonas_calceolata.AAC.2
MHILSGTLMDLLAPDALLKWLLLALVNKTRHRGLLMTLMPIAFKEKLSLGEGDTWCLGPSYSPGTLPFRMSHESEQHALSSLYMKRKEKSTQARSSCVH